jgi:hypothetical protein
VIGRHDHDGLAGRPAVSPGGERFVDHLLPGPAADPAVRLVVAKDGVITVAQRQGGLRLPGVEEAADLVEFGGAAVGDEELEESAGFDRAELAVVADENELGAARLDGVHQGSKIGGGHHGRLIDDQDLPGAQASVGVPVAPRLVEVLGHRVGWDPGLLG